MLRRRHPLSQLLDDNGYMEVAVLLTCQLSLKRGVKIDDKNNVLRRLLKVVESDDRFSAFRHAWISAMQTR